MQRRVILRSIIFFSIVVITLLTIVSCELFNKTECVGCYKDTPWSTIDESAPCYPEKDSCEAVHGEGECVKCY